MNTDRLAYFLAVVRDGSFSAAARTMYVSQTAISQQIAALEKELGCVLFRRTATGAFLTEHGTEFLPFAEQVMHIELEMKDTFANTRKQSVVHIGYNGPLEKELMVEAYLKIHDKFPNLVIEPMYMSLAAMPDALYRGQCDAIITLDGEVKQQGIYQELIRDVPMVAAVSKVSPLAAKEIISIEEMTQYPIVLLAPDQSKSIQSEIHEWALRLGFPEEGIIYADSTDLQLLMVSLNLGVSFFPQVESSYLQGIELIPTTTEAGRHRSVLAARRLTPGIRALHEAMKQGANGEP